MFTLIYAHWTKYLDPNTWNYKVDFIRKNFNTIKMLSQWLRRQKTNKNWKYIEFYFIEKNWEYVDILNSRVINLTEVKLISLNLQKYLNLNLNV